MKYTWMARGQEVLYTFSTLLNNDPKVSELTILTALQSEILTNLMEIAKDATAAAVEAEMHLLKTAERMIDYGLAE
jgi:DNA-binding MurR/RpiR family transcriptional regulator